MTTPQAAGEVAGEIGASALQAAADIVALPGPILEPLGLWPSHVVMQSIEAIHLATDMPYWATIVAITFGLRALLVPLAFGAMRNGAKMALAKPEMELVTQRMKAETASGVTVDQKRYQMYQTQLNAIYAKHGFYPMRSLLMPVVQLPIFVSFFLGLQSMGTYFPVGTSSPELEWASFHKGRPLDTTENTAWAVVIWLG